MPIPAIYIGSDADGTVNNPLLPPYSIAITAEGRLKIGPGYWNSLSYVDNNNNGEAVTSVIGLQGVITGAQLKTALALGPSNIAGFNTAASAAAPVQSIAGLTGSPNATTLKTAIAIAPSDISGFNAAAASAAPVQSIAGLTGSPNASTVKTALSLAVGDVSGAFPSASLGIANGAAGLDSTGKVPTSQLPASILGALNYQGTWNANTNTPTLVSSTGTKGFYYKVTTAGTTAIDGISQWNVGDSIAFDGTTWDKFEGIANELVSVAGLSGVVSAASLKTALALGPGDISGFNAAASSAAPVQSIAGLTGTPNASAIKTALAITSSDISGFNVAVTALAPTAISLGLPPIGQALVTNVWVTLPAISKIVLIGTGSVSIDTKDAAGNITSAMFSQTVSGATATVSFPPYTNAAVAMRPIITGSLTVEMF